MLHNTFGCYSNRYFVCKNRFILALRNIWYNDISLGNFMCTHIIRFSFDKSSKSLENLFYNFMKSWDPPPISDD